MACVTHMACWRCMQIDAIISNFGTTACEAALVYASASRFRLLCLDFKSAATAVAHTSTPYPAHSRPLARFPSPPHRMSQPVPTASSHAPSNPAASSASHSGLGAEDATGSQAASGAPSRNGSCPTVFAAPWMQPLKRALGHGGA